MLSDPDSSIYYTALVAQSSTGKTKAQKIFHKAVESIEQYYQVSIIESKQINAATVESLLGYLHGIPSMIGKLKIHICADYTNKSSFDKLS